MALGRRASHNMSHNIWPGFVDAMGSLLLVLIFVLSVFMIVQSVLRDTITTQDGQLESLSSQVAQLADALGLETTRAARLEQELSAAQAEGQAQATLIASLTGQLATRQAELEAATTRITGFEQQVLALIAERDSARGEGARLQASLAEAEAARTALLSEQEALNLALASARSEMDAAAEAARLAAARREALEAMVADLRRQQAEGQTALSEAERRLAEQAQTLSEAEAARLAEAAAAEALRNRLETADAELTAMTLALEDQRRRAEDTLTQLAAADAARKDIDARLAAALLAQQTTQADLEALKAQGADMEAVRRDLAAAIAARLAAETATTGALSEAERRAALLATAQRQLTQEQARTAEQARQVAVLNEQLAALRAQLGSLQSLLEAAETADSDKRLQLESLGSQLNTALAQVAAEQRRRAELEEAERRRLEAEKQNLERFRSEFFGELRQVLAGRDGVRIVGDRFVFSSEVLFNPGSADLAPEGQAQIARVAATLLDAARDIPQGIDWILRVDGHTDDVPLSGQGEFRDNWELSQARALSVVRFMQGNLGFPPDRMAATGFGEYRPVAAGDSAEARAQNRRIELKLTER
ncbi:chemotaxis protein MotB [Gemmobacter megaterium]|uniref:Chemotaxis protein MotB n=1 Tax=Gemmobacter megaterium TaxID=1086013 RepID=A0A1N7KD62_9RHOB|nr:peptidoglycan -binding protein [Gemmobacter megaterium]GGE01452.1 flagellar motor protein [Gemmobacter megaterium]SIS59489.1 chemotaxis protein MotB [Gemmobacter megaterium]